MVVSNRKVLHIVMQNISADCNDILSGLTVLDSSDAELYGYSQPRDWHIVEPNCNKLTLWNTVLILGLQYIVFKISLDG